jgi:conjugal transfer pilus assembly protein TraI
MLNWFGVRGRKRGEGEPPPPRVEPVADIPDGATANDGGIALIPVDRVLAPHAELLERISLAYGRPKEIYRQHIESVVRRYAEFVHLLPATATNFFCEQGGLLQMGLEVGFMALQASDTALFAGREVLTTRMELEPRWKYATFLAGLLSEIHRAFSQLSVTGGLGGQDWPAYQGPLASWCERNRVQRYFLRWSPRSQEIRGQALFAVPHVVGADLMQYLAFGNSALVPHMLGCISGIPPHSETNVIDDLVRRAGAVVIESYLAASARRYGRPMVGTHIERFLVDAMQRLVVSGKWTINSTKSRLWFGEDGLYLVWPGGADDVVALLERDRLPGIPKSSESIAQTLMEADAFSRNTEGGVTYWIHPPEACDPLSAVRIANPLMLLAPIHNRPEAICRKLEVHRPADAPATTTLAPSRAEIPNASPAQGRLTLASGDDVGGDDDDEGNEPLRFEEAQLDSSCPKPAPARISLRDTPRLPSHIRSALAGIVATLNEPDLLGAVYIDEHGLFVPLSEFQARNVDKAAAVRALQEAGLLVLQADDSRTKQVQVRGEDVLGVVIAARFIEGWRSPREAATQEG